MIAIEDKLRIQGEILASANNDIKRQGEYIKRLECERDVLRAVIDALEGKPVTSLIDEKLNCLENNGSFAPASDVNDCGNLNPL